MKGSLSILAAITMVAICSEAKSQELTADEKALITSETATATKPQLPIQLDEYTTITAVLAGTDKLIYVMNLSISESDVEGELQPQLQEIFVQNMCGKESVRTKFLDAGINVEAVYKYNNGAVAANFLVTKDSCSG